MAAERRQPKPSQTQTVPPPLRSGARPPSLKTATQRRISTISLRLPARGNKAVEPCMKRTRERDKKKAATSRSVSLRDAERMLSLVRPCQSMLWLGRNLMSLLRSNTFHYGSDAGLLPKVLSSFLTRRQPSNQSNTHGACLRNTALSQVCVCCARDVSAKHVVFVLASPVCRCFPHGTACLCVEAAKMVASLFSSSILHTVTPLWLIYQFPSPAARCGRSSV